MTNTDPTSVFVLGAGASKEAGLPLGSELKKVIADALDIRFEFGTHQISGDGELAEALRHAAQAAIPPSRDINPHLRAAWRIRDAMPQAISIDNFVDSHADDPRIVMCGKLAIAKSILDAERRSALYIDRANNQKRVNFERLAPTWFNAFFQLLTENCRRQDIEGRIRSVALVDFNYDRCVEQYLHLAIQNYYGHTPQESASILNKLEIHHPYGQVGTLPWQSAQTPLDFGETPGPGPLLHTADGIKTFAEGTQSDDPAFQRLTHIMATARRVVFLGFAFHRQNIDLLFPATAPTRSDSPRCVYGTALNLSASDVGDIVEQVTTRAGITTSNIKLGNSLTCAGLFREYWRSLSLHRA